MENIVGFLKNMTLEDCERWITLLTAVGGTIVALVQFGTRNKIARDALRRQRREATVPLLQTLLDEIDNITKRVNMVFPSEEATVIEPDDGRWLDNQDNVRLEVADLLSKMERVAVGINMGIYDLEVFASYRGQKTIGTWERWREIIASKRREGNQGEELYKEFERLKDDLYKHYREKGQPFVSKYQKRSKTN